MRVTDFLPDSMNRFQLQHQLQLTIALVASRELNFNMNNRLPPTSTGTFASAPTIATANFVLIGTVYALFDT